MPDTGRELIQRCEKKENTKMSWIKTHKWGVKNQITGGREGGSKMRQKKNPLLRLLPLPPFVNIEETGKKCKPVHWRICRPCSRHAVLEVIQALFGCCCWCHRAIGTSRGDLWGAEPLPARWCPASHWVHGGFSKARHQQHPSGWSMWCSGHWVDQTALELGIASKHLKFKILAQP